MSDRAKHVLALVIAATAFLFSLGGLIALFLREPVAVLGTMALLWFMERRLARWLECAKPHRFGVWNQVRELEVYTRRCENRAVSGLHRCVKRETLHTYDDTRWT